MVSFARARTKSLLSRLWPMKVLLLTNNVTEWERSKELTIKQNEQDKRFIEASKNGGIWFS